MCLCCGIFSILLLLFGGGNYDGCSGVGGNALGGDFHDVGSSGGGGQFCSGDGYGCGDGS